MSCSIPTKSTTERNLSQQASNPSINVRDTLVRIPECKVILMNEGEAGEVAAGDFELQWISDGDVALAAAVKVGEKLQWPLTKDGPVVKLDALNYLFSLQMNDGQPLSYGVEFAPETSGGLLGQLDALLMKHSLFTAAQKKKNVGIDWKKFAPAVDQYNTLLGQAIAIGTGHVIRGIFKCTEAYTNKVQEIGETIQIPGVGENNADQPEKIISDSGVNKNKASLNKALIHAKKLTKMTYEITKTMVDVVDEAAESVREARVASIDAVKKLLEATEAANKEAIKFSAGAVQDAVTRRCGERAGERTGHVFEIVGNCASTLCNIFKIRKAIVSCWTAICCSKSNKKMD
ncbi:senescence/dehydration-associated protein At4g35985, chloroplastic-like [Salvia splendens]|uniref:senescence/dehydration-associated protein At4g35985, chloroplastic-like n=1 Tax=Salvia splendens TaxID=180675 RepID=UPI0011035324|nr:senescence/dehydration-associated protein At4g35985, chloroplastic-like [Salvia splendens]